MEIIQKCMMELAKLEQVMAITLGGSRASGLSDKDSDYDIYIYCQEPIPKEERKKILENYCNYIELGNTYWEEEDDCRLKTGTVMEIIYRDYASFDRQLIQTVIYGNANNGYTTCMWNNLLTSKILYEKEKCYSKLVEKYRVPYPRKLKEAIIRKNYELLTGYIPSFDEQIKKAYKRKDYISVNHRITEYVASYFDLVFAANEVLHPGEKRMLSIALDKCERLPEKIKQIETMIMESSHPEKALACLEQLTEDMKKFMIKYNLLP
ncbi:nucleotidyltransferase domain-containing protein [Anaerosporobacter faecicola]|uniref:nucleotidyltransferase domain-containing protein n=1 Tax=Anaerosporobacter faecicola TaxID=2718714 RepID=UPI00143BC2F9|nr:nucleotidyltransferase domain-containing protein [Anaerosporobacter faecicola]